MCHFSKNTNLGLACVVVLLNIFFIFELLLALFFEYIEYARYNTEAQAWPIIGILFRWLASMAERRRAREAIVLYNDYHNEIELVAARRRSRGFFSFFRNKRVNYYEREYFVNVLSDTISLAMVFMKIERLPGDFLEFMIRLGLTLQKVENDDNEMHKTMTHMLEGDFSQMVAWRNRKHKQQLFKHHLKLNENQIDEEIDKFYKELRNQLQQSESDNRSSKPDEPRRTSRFKKSIDFFRKDRNQRKQRKDKTSVPKGDLEELEEYETDTIEVPDFSQGSDEQKNKKQKRKKQENEVEVIPLDEYIRRMKSPRMPVRIATSSEETSEGGIGLHDDDDKLDEVAKKRPIFFDIKLSDAGPEVWEQEIALLFDKETLSSGITVADLYLAFQQMKLHNPEAIRFQFEAFQSRKKKLEIIERNQIHARNVTLQKMRDMLYTQELRVEELEEGEKEKEAEEEEEEEGKEEEEEEKEKEREDSVITIDDYNDLQNQIEAMRERCNLYQQDLEKLKENPESFECDIEEEWVDMNDEEIPPQNSENEMDK